MLQPYAIWQPAEALLIILATVSGSVATYEVVRRSSVLRPLFGLKGLPTGAGC